MGQTPCCLSEIIRQAFPGLDPETLVSGCRTITAAWLSAGNVTGTGPESGNAWKSAITERVLYIGIGTGGEGLVCTEDRWIH